MRRLSTACVAVLAASGPAIAGQVDSGLEAILQQTAAEETVSTLVYVDHQLDVEGITRRMDAERATLRLRHEEVVRSLQDLAAVTQVEITAELARLKAAGAISDYQAYWVGNIIRVDGTPETIRAIAARNDVATVYFNYPIELIEPVASSHKDGPGDRAVEIGVEAVRAPEVWAMGFTGEGVLTSTLDTGVDGNHPALASRWRGVADPRYADNPEWAFFDPVTNQTFPFDSGSHGTHTMGSVCGGPPGDEIGVAPGAQWIHCAVIDRVSISQTVADAILSFQWLLDPNEDPSSNWDVPAVCSNSWGLMTVHGYPPCDQTFWVYLDNCEAAGIVILFSAGNEGTSGLRRPADRATDDYRTCAVAAVDANNPSWPIASFSSRGPTYCTPDNTAATKPDIAAPGVDVRSSVPGGGYSYYSGTSMASPHVNGVVALMRQANPDLSVEQIKQIIYDTAYDLGIPGEDNDYGWGMIDAYEAVLLALSSVNLTFDFPNGRPEFINPNGGETIRVVVSGESVEPKPGSGKFYYGTGTEYTEVAMDEVEPNVYDAVFPAFDCGAIVYYYFSAETMDNDIVYNPYTAPDYTYHGTAYSGIAYDFQDDFETDQGWTVEDSGGLTTGTWERGIPQGGGDRGDPPSDADGSGQCYVTGLADGDNDIDDGTTTLISPVMDATLQDGIISYYRWYSNSFGNDPYNDIFYVDVSDDAGATWVNLETVGPGGSEVSGGWYHKEFLLADIPGITVNDQFRIRFVASDLNDGSVVEAGVDGVQIKAYYCDEPECPEDVNLDGVVDIDDLFEILGHWGEGAGTYDVNGDGIVDIDDVFAVLAAWGPC
ncbi:MAG: S8 family serine peptidase [Phycisphaerales bacterium]|nr:MAG: S8 family serine peptidase [Phycisphaerales bacterium]